MPRSMVLAVAPRFTTVDRLIELKKIWNVSVAALAYRMHTAGRDERLAVPHRRH